MSSRSKGNERFLALFGEVQLGLSRYARALMRDREEARDLVSETVTIAYEHFESLRDDRAFKSYLYTTATRLAHRKQKRERKFEPFDAAIAETLYYNGAAPDAGVDIELLYKALEQLPEAMREAVVLFEISGLSLLEIQEIQGGSLSGVKSRIARGREKLANLLGARNDEPQAVREETMSIVTTPAPVALARTRS
jgi:RNA polymerase sigma-70 factor, ECF subfamily